MTVIMCLDKNDGMLFNNRRQTVDYEVVDRICRDGGASLYISPFSEEYFSGRDVRRLEEPLLSAPDNATVFIENKPLLPYINKVDKIIIYRWSKSYPVETKCDIKPLDEGFRLAGRIKFSTRVHEDTIKEIYKR